MDNSLTRIQWIGFVTIVFREFHRIVRIWGQTIVPPTVTATLYFVIFGSIFGPAGGAGRGATVTCSSSPRPDHDDGDHQLLRQRGLLVLRRQVRKHLEELLVSPLPQLADPVGLCRRAACSRGLLVGLVSRWSRCFCTRLAVQHVMAVLSAVLLTSLVFSLGGFLNALFAKNFDQISWFPTFVLAAADLPGRRVLFDHDAAVVGAGRLPRQSDPITCERIPVAIPGVDRCRPAARLRHHGRIRGCHVHARRGAVEQGCGHTGMTDTPVVV